MRTSRLVVATAAILGLGLTACSDDTPTSTSTPAPESTTTTSPERPTTAVDELVATDSGRLHLRCAGSGATTVLLLAGWGDAGDSWDAIRPSIERRTRVCSYSRLGTGTSDPPTTTQTFGTQAVDLHDLLAAAAEPGPYVVVGHSFGGPEGVTFAAQYPSEVIGLLLLDATPATWPAAVCAVADGGTAATQPLRELCTVYHDATKDPERLDVFPSFDHVAAIESLADLPVVVMTADHRTAPGLGERELARLNAAWSDGVERWAALSTSSRVVTVEGTGHYIQLDQPDVVVAELLALLPSRWPTGEPGI